MYDFRNLSPLDFEELVRDLLQLELKVRLESFGAGRDSGVDLRYAKGTEHLVVQAKHYSDSDARSLERSVRKEDTKIGLLQPKRYILATSQSMTPGLKQRLIQALKSITLEPEDVLGRQDLNNLLRRHPEVETSHFKLWLTSTKVLQRILHAGIYNRTESELETIAALIPKFVQNDGIKVAESILDRAGTLIITGQPGVGKTTLARMLIWLHAANGWQISVVDDIKDAFDISSGKEKRLIFFDDFLGQVKLSDDVVRGADQRFLPFFQRVRQNKNLRFILTSRDYILRQAQLQSQRLSESVIHASEMVLNVGDYTRAIRARMLVNHLYFSDLADEERAALIEDDYFLQIIDHRNFNPRLISVLTTAEYIAMAGRPIRESVQAVLDDPSELWERPYRSHISAEGRVLMLALLLNGSGVGVATLENTFRRLAKALELPAKAIDLPNLFRASLKELEGSVVALERREARFSNPGVRDFLNRIIRKDGMLPILLSSVCEYEELSQAWAIFSSWGKYSERKTHPAIKCWSSPLRRIVENKSGSDFERFSLALEIYGQTQDETALDLFIAAIEDLAEAGLGGDEVTQAARMLEDKVMWDMPMDLAEETHEALTVAVANGLENYGGSMAVEDLESTARALLENGADSVSSRGAASRAVGEFLDGIEGALNDISSLGQLKEFEDEVRRVANEFGHFGRHAEEKFETRREELSEREEAFGDYRSSWTRPAPSLGNSEIRSMFSVLRK